MGVLDDLGSLGEITLEEFLDKIPIPIFVLNKDHQIIAWNSSCETLTGILRENILGKTWESLNFYDPPRPVLADLILDGADIEKIRSFYGEACHPWLSNHESWEGEIFLPKINGGTWIKFAACPIRDKKGNVIGALETLVNINEIKEKEFKLQKYSDRLELLNKIVREISGEDSLQGLFDRSLSLLKKKLNYSNISILAQDPTANDISLSIVAATYLDRDLFRELSEKLKESGKGLTYKAAREKRVINTPSVTGNDDYFPLTEGTKAELDVPILFSDRLLGVICVEGTSPFGVEDEKIFQLLADQLGVLWKEIEGKEIIKRQATMDQLTNLPNRFLLFSRLKEEQNRLLRYGGRMALAMMDLVGFKAINDNLGHFVGDKVLREIGKALKSTLRESDFCARFGGDEFVILFPCVPHEEVLTAISRLRSALSEIRIEELPDGYPIEADFGLAFYPDDGKNLTALLQLADQRMYEEKRRMQRLRGL